MKRSGLGITMAAVMSMGAAAWGAEVASVPKTPTVPEGAYRRSDALVWVTLGFGVLHHTDHVIRDNHSGFPFTTHVTAFTPTLLVYPLVIGGIAFDAGPLYWTIFDAAALVGVVAIHATLEPCTTSTSRGPMVPTSPACVRRRWAAWPSPFWVG